MVTMLNNSIKLSEKDRICLGDIIKRDHRMLKGPSEALRVIMEDAAEDVPDWREVQRRADELGYPKELMIGTDIATFKIDEEAFIAVFGAIKQQLRLTKPRTAFVIRMCMLNARLKLQSDKKIGLDEESIINEKSALLENFRKQSLEEQLFEIYKILLERRDGE